MREAASEQQLLHGIGLIVAVFQQQPAAGMQMRERAPGEHADLVMRFADYADPVNSYMYHCHLIAHEDAGMMGQFLVLAPGQQPKPMAMPMSAPTGTGMPAGMDMPAHH